jgi:hypothetical protein
VFNIKPSIARQFQEKDEETANELWIAIKSKYHRANHVQMIAIENQLANLQIHDTPNIIDEINQFITLQKELVSLGSKLTKASLYTVYGQSCLSHSQHFVTPDHFFPTHWT